MPGNRAEAMELHAYTGIEEVLINLPLTYQTDLRLGTLTKPVVLDIAGMTTSIDELRNGRDADYYDLGGRKLNDRPKQQGIYIRGKEKVVIKNK